MSGGSYDQQPFSDLTLVENPEDRCAVVLLLDNSGSMGGAPIDQLNSGVQLFRDELFADSLAAKRVEVAIVTFGPVTVQSDFATAQNFFPPTLAVAGDTPMGAAVEKAVEMLADRKAVYKQHSVNYYRPWIFMITDGGPTDSITRAAQLVRDGEKAKQFMFFPVGVQGANMEALRALSVREPIALQGLKFRQLFEWLSSSLSAVSKSQPADQPPALPSPSGWAVAG